MSSLKWLVLCFVWVWSPRSVQGDGRQDLLEQYASLMQLPSTTLRQIETAVQEDRTAQFTSQDASFLQIYIRGFDGLFRTKKTTTGIPDDAGAPVSFKSRLLGTFSSQLTQAMPIPSRQQAPGQPGNYEPPNDEVVTCSSCY